MSSPAQFWEQLQKFITPMLTDDGLSMSTPENEQQQKRQEAIRRAGLRDIKSAIKVCS